MRTSDADWAGGYFARSVAAATALAEDATVRTVIADMARITIAAMQTGGKLMIAGNGGSAADAQHIAGEFVSRLMYDRVPLPAIALTPDAAVMTASANDYGYEHVFARQVAALGRPGDVLLAISTSGRSANVLRALETAKERGLYRLGFTGRTGGQMAALCEPVLRVPADETAIIQQLHITAAHVFCGLVERALCPPP